jgi:catechol 2,3-dioxygenase-like lactoylglutathione lyase family enzyme
LVSAYLNSSLLLNQETERVVLRSLTWSVNPLESNKASDTGSSHVCFKTDDVNARYERLLANDVVVHCSPQRVADAMVMYFRDPDGIILEAIEGKTKV